MRAIIYVRVSTEEQGRSGLSLASQKAACLHAVKDRGWRVERVVVEQASAGGKRPLLDAALDELGDLKKRGALVVARLDRLSRSVGQFATIMDMASHEGWTILVLDPPVDLSTSFGRAMAGMASVFAQLERDLISQRTKEGQDEARRRGWEPGSHMRYENAEVIARIVTMHRAGITEDQIAERLTLMGVPTPKGGPKWSRATIHKLRVRGERTMPR